MFEPAMETGPGHAEQFRRLGLVSLGSFQRPRDQLLLDIFQELSQHDRLVLATRVSRRLVGPADLVRQLSGFHKRTVSGWSVLLARFNALARYSPRMACTSSGRGEPFSGTEIGSSGSHSTGTQADSGARPRLFHNAA